MDPFGEPIAFTFSPRGRLNRSFQGKPSHRKPGLGTQVVVFSELELSLSSALWAKNTSESDFLPIHSGLSLRRFADFFDLLAFDLLTFTFRI
jgi:hypothetical protein